MLNAKIVRSYFYNYYDYISKQSVVRVGWDREKCWFESAVDVFCFTIFAQSVRMGCCEGTSYECFQLVLKDTLPVFQMFVTNSTHLKNVISVGHKWYPSGGILHLGWWNSRKTVSPETACQDRKSTSPPIPNDPPPHTHIFSFLFFYISAYVMRWLLVLYYSVVLLFVNKWHCARKYKYTYRYYHLP